MTTSRTDTEGATMNDLERQEIVAGIFQAIREGDDEGAAISDYATEYGYSVEEVTAVFDAANRLPKGK